MDTWSIYLPRDIVSRWYSFKLMRTNAFNMHPKNSRQNFSIRHYRNFLRGKKKLPNEILKKSCPFGVLRTKNCKKATFWRKCDLFNFWTFFFRFFLLYAIEKILQRILLFSRLSDFCQQWESCRLMYLLPLHLCDATRCWRIVLHCRKMKKIDKNWSFPRWFFFFRLLK